METATLMATLSILTPSFNYGWSLEDALRSVSGAGRLLPAGWSVEHVVVDDASNDDSGEVLERWASRIVLERRAENHGQSNTLNRCLSLATGEWVGWLNADDFYLDRSLRDACEALDERVDVVYGDAVQADASGRLVRLLAEHSFTHWTLRWWGTFLPAGAVFIRRSLLERLRWREDLSLLLDWDLWLRAAESGARFRYLPAPLAVIRRHPGQESQQDRPERLAEKAGVRRERGLPSRPWAWRAAQRVAGVSHGVRKLVSGSYARERRAATLRGRSMRWFGDPEARPAVDSLYRLAYRGRARASERSADGETT